MPSWFDLTDAVAAALLGVGVVLLATAVVFERRMHGHRQPGVTYAQATWRKDGGWRRAELFTAEGLRLQKKAAAFGWLGALALLMAIAVRAVST